MPRTRRSFLKAGITAGAAGSALGFPMIARAQQSFNWKMTSAYAKGAYTSCHSGIPPPS